MRHLIVLAAAAALLAGCAGYSRVTEYPAHLPKNVTNVQIDGGRTFLIKTHPRDPTILIQPTSGRVLTAGLASTLTLGAISMDNAAAIEPQYRAAAEKFAAAHGCTVAQLYKLESVSYEAKLACPGR